jgi:hypothetical protein
VFAVNIVVMLAFTYGILVASREMLLSLSKKHPRFLGWIGRIIEGDDLAQAAARTKLLRDEVAELQAVIAGFLPRAAAIGELLPAHDPSAAGLVLEVQRLQEAYARHLSAAAVRISRFGSDAEEMRVLFDLELAVLRAELHRARAFNAIEEQVRIISEA